MHLHSLHHIIPISSSQDFNPTSQSLQSTPSYLHVPAAPPNSIDPPALLPPKPALATHPSPLLEALAYVSTSASTKPTSPPPPQPDEREDDGRVRAYAKLEFPQHDFFIRKLTVTIGRRPPSRPDPPPIPTEEEDGGPIDVDLGPIRAVSRRHARIYFDWARGRWTLSVAGRNGCVVDGRWRARGEVLALGSRTKIQIAERIFYFILPQLSPPAPPPAPSPPIECPPEIELLPSDSGSEHDAEPDPPPLTLPQPISDHLPSNSFQLPTRPPPRSPHRPKPVDVDPVPRPPVEEDSDLSEVDDEEEHDEDQALDHLDEPDELPAPPFQPEPPPPFHPEPPLPMFDDPETDESLSDEMGRSDDEPRPPSPPRVVPIYPHAGGSGDSESDDSDEDVMLSSEAFDDPMPSKMPKKTSGKVPKKAWSGMGAGKMGGGKIGGGKGGGGKGGGGKGGGGKGGGGKIAGGRSQGGKGGGGKGGKSSSSKTVSLDIPTPGLIEVDAQPSSPRKESTQGKGKGKSKGKSKEDSKSADATANTPTVPPVIIKERRKIVCVSPPGADVGTETRKPPYTYASMIAQALTAQADEDGKMLVNEMCEWIAGVYPFYGIKPKGTDWQSAVRHNLNADKRFKRIERQPCDGGKGNFWTLRPEERVNFDGLELRRPKPDPPPKPPPKAEQRKPSASIANLARDGVVHRRVEERVVITSAPSPSTPTPPPVASSSSVPTPIPTPIPTGLRAPPPTPTVITPMPRAPPPTPKPVALPSLGSFATARVTPSDRLNPALLAADTPPAPSRPPPAFQIIIEPLPPSTTPVPANSSTDELTAMMLRDPPMVSQANRLVLNPSVFGKLTEVQVKALERLGPAAAIKILQTYIVEHYKEVMKKARRKGKEKAPTGPQTNRDPALLGAVGNAGMSVGVKRVLGEEGASGAEQGSVEKKSRVD